MIYFTAGMLNLEQHLADRIIHTAKRCEQRAA